MYAYYEKNEQYLENLRYFLKNVIVKNPPIDFFVIINGKCSIKTFPRNVRVIHRENKGFDFGAFSHCISKHMKRTYDYYIFLNSSVRGPFPKDIDWVHAFLNLFNNDVKLVGTSINLLDGLPHVQSQFFVLDKEGFSYLKDEHKFFDEKDPVFDSQDINEIIWSKEIRMSSLILEKGWNINAILMNYKNRDYRKLKKNINPTGPDPFFPNSYWGRSILPEEAIFFKINRFPSGKF